MDQKLSVRSAVLAWFLALLSGCAGTGGSTEANDDIGDRFRAERVAKANALALEGDRALAGGGADQAVLKYAQALKAVGLRGRFGFDGKNVADGYQLSEITPDLPFARAGLRVGDVLIRARGTPMAGLSGSSSAWFVLFQRDPGEPMQVVARRPGAAPFEVTVASAHALWRPGVVREAEEDLIRSLRFKAAAAAGRAATLPPIPAAAREHAKRAQALARSAKTQEEFADAADEYRIASLLAPWWSDLLINYALLQEAGEDAIGARESLALYVEARPNAPDRASASQKQAALAGKAEEQKRLMAWEGFWGEIVNGRRTDSGIRFERKGKIITAKNNRGFEYLRGTIVDEYTAQSVQRFNPDNAGSLGPAVRRCFNGLLEFSGTIKLAPDKQRLTLTMQDFLLDQSTCRVQSSSHVISYGR